MRRHTIFFLLPVPATLVLAVVLAWSPPAAAEAPRPAVIAYVFPRDRILDPSEIRAEKLTHVNFAFANVVGGRVVEGGPNDGPNLKVLTSLRRDHPQLRMSVSVGGWTWSKGFSDAAFTAKSRRVFVASAVDFVRRHDLDGFDVDWEYPGLPGDGNPHRPEDKENFTALMADLRAALDREGARRGRPLLLTFAAGASRDFLAHTEMAKVQAVVNFVNLMTYDFRVANPGAPAGHHANLYPSPADPRSHSADGAVKDFLAAGVPASKLVLGVPFYGRAWEGVGSREGLYRDGKSPSQRIDTSHASLAALVGREGWTREWDTAAQAPFLLNEARTAFVTYEDEESLRLKSRYVLEKGLGGVMFWEYHADRTGALLDTLDAALRGTDVMPLAGVWRFALDPADEGLVAFWENRTLADRIRLPGVLQAQGFGDDVTVDTQWTGQIVDRSFFTAPRYEPYRQPGNVKVPFWLQPEKYYAGAAWYQRDVDIPPEWKGRRVVLLLERPHWETPVWLDGRVIGSNDSLSTPHEYDLGYPRARDAPADDPGRQPPGRGHRRELAQRQRPHAGQLERDRRPDRAARRAAGVDRRPAGVPERSRRERRSSGAASATRRARPARGTLRLERAAPGGPARSSRKAAEVSCGRAGGAFEASCRSARVPAPGTSSRPRSTGSDGNACEAGEARDMRAVLRLARDRTPGHPVHHQRPEDLPPRHARVRDLPEDRPSADRRRVVEAHHPASRRRTA